jgi:hypothetical protein
VWAENAGGSGRDYYESVTAVADGYVAVGSSDSTDAIWGNNGGSDAIIVKYDLNGNVVWVENAGGSASDRYDSVTAVADGYVVVGSSYSTDALWGNNGSTDAIIVKYFVEPSEIPTAPDTGYMKIGLLTVEKDTVLLYGAAILVVTGFVTVTILKRKYLKLQ